MTQIGKDASTASEPDLAEVRLPWESIDPDETGTPFESDAPEARQRRVLPRSQSRLTTLRFLRSRRRTTSQIRKTRQNWKTSRDPAAAEAGPFPFSRPELA